jgi:hypothetical protein
MIAVIANPISGSAIRTPSPTTMAEAATPRETKAVDAGVVAVRDQRRAVEPRPATEAHPCRDLVPDEPHDAGRREHPNLRQLLRADQPIDRFVQSDERADQDGGNDSEIEEARVSDAGLRF